MLEHDESSTEQSDAQLALAAREGDLAARNTLYMRYRSLVSRRITPARLLARWLAERGAPVSADDVTQEAFIIFCRLLKDWQPERCPFVPYMVNMIPQAVYSHLREQQHLRSTRLKIVRLAPKDGIEDEGSAGDYEVEVSPQSTGASADEAVLSKERWEELVGQLSEDWARLLRMRFWEDKSSHHIAQTLGCSQRTANRRLRAALDTIRQQVAEDWEGI